MAKKLKSAMVTGTPLRGCRGVTDKNGLDSDLCHLCPRLGDFEQKGFRAHFL
jgi:hypothetical protein